MSSKPFKNSIVGRAPETAKSKKKRPSGKSRQGAGNGGRQLKMVGGYKVEETATGLFVPHFGFEVDSDDDTIFDEPVTLSAADKGRISGNAESDDEADQLPPPSVDDESTAFFSALSTKSGSRGKDLYLSDEDQSSRGGWDLSMAQTHYADNKAEFRTSLMEKIQERMRAKQAEAGGEGEGVGQSRSGSDSQDEDGSSEVDGSDLEAQGSEGSEAGGSGDDDDDEEEGVENDGQEEDDEEDDGEEEEGSDDWAASSSGPTKKEGSKKHKELYKFSAAPETPVTVSFQDMNLSRALLKSVTKLGYSSPTPIQQKAIPIVLLGRDVCGSAVTGSGKTAAFMLPVLERLQYRSRRVNISRVVVLLPTRELAAQCHSMTQKLAQFTDITCSLIVGGLSMKKQEMELRQNPDIIIATPGRLIDHLLNSRSVGLEDIEILIMDEADRLLDMGFEEEIQQILKACPTHRQTMLFSATMTEAVDRLIKLSLTNPVRVSVDQKYDVAQLLVQEFIRIRPSREQDREAMLVSLVTTEFTSRVMIFVGTKLVAHRLCVIFGLFNLSTAELHGNLTQAQRLEALEAFQSKKVEFLIATDLASRGLDIAGVTTVINFQMPSKLKTYIHRVGRTARAGNEGRAISFIAERDRDLMKAALKAAQASKNRPGKTLQRKVPVDQVISWTEKIELAESDISAIIEEEKLERCLGVADQEHRRLTNLLQHREEIYSRPARQWFQDSTQKEISREKSLAAIAGVENVNMKATKKAEYQAKKAEKRRVNSEARKRGQQQGPLANLDSEERAIFLRAKAAATATKRELKRSAKLRGVSEFKMRQIDEQRQAAKDGTLDRRAAANKEKIKQHKELLRNPDLALEKLDPQSRKRPKPPGQKTGFKSKRKYKRKK